ncbi:hypothetical protein WG954_03845 [Lacibacter sp. H375]|uniref:hypothetical protein n=1 Tax=Lacibacter sp. H375 TaxID=3133424 RepID=UPI0030C353A6
MKELNFEYDLQEELKRLSSSIGFKVANYKPLDKMLLDYLTVRTKIIEPLNRTVLINPRFKLEILTHPKKKEIEFVINAAAEGRNLNVFQNKRLLESNFHDHLQNEWNIFHFHLSLKKEKKSKFVKQVNSLLFAYINKEHIVFLGSDTHNDDVFGNPKWIEVLHDFFPDIIKEYRNDEIVSVYPKVNSKERQTLWNKGYTLGMTEIRGVVYHSPGVGRATSGHSLMNSRTADEILRWIYKLKEQVLDSHHLLCKYLQIDEHLAKFKIRFGEETLELYERTTEETLVVFPDILQEKTELEKRIIP